MIMLKIRNLSETDFLITCDILSQGVLYNSNYIEIVD